MRRLTTRTRFTPGNDKARAAPLSSVICLLALAWGAHATEPAQTPTTDAQWFDDTVRPILERSCFECHSHSAGKMKNGLTLDSRDGWASGGLAAIKGSWLGLGAAAQAQ